MLLGGFVVLGDAKGPGGAFCIAAVRGARVTPGRAPVAHVPVVRDVRAPWLWATGQSSRCASFKEGSWVFHRRTLRVIGPR